MALVGYFKYTMLVRRFMIDFLAEKGFKAYSMYCYRDMVYGNSGNSFYYPLRYIGDDLDELMDIDLDIRK